MFKWLKQPDKELHCLAAALITITVFFLMDTLFHRPNWGYWLGSFIAFASCLGKEIYDSFHQEEHSVEFLDIFAGMIGIGVMDLILSLRFIK